MCIVSIVTNPQGQIILTQNRDENRMRPTSDEVASNEKFGKIYTGPRDLVSGGTWIYYTKEYMVCILNGAYQKHHHNPPYRKSRGLVVLDLLKYDSIDEFVNSVVLEGVEPFTMIMIHRKTGEKKILVWNEEKKFLEDHSGEELIVRSSSTLYDEDEKAFHQKEILHLNPKTPENLRAWHHRARMLPNTKFPMVQTTSITQIIQSDTTIKLKFCPIP